VRLTNNRRPQAFVAALAGLMLAGTAVAAPLVVRSTGPSAKAYPAGKALAADAKLSLKAGDTIVLLDGKGTRTISGPGTFSASASSVAAASTGSTLAALASGGGERRARIGAVRSASGIDKNAGKNPNMWFVDVTRSTNVCVANPAAVTIWRPDASAPATVNVSGPSGASGTIELPAGRADGQWPASVPVTDGGQYKLSWAGAKAPTAVKFLLVKPTTGTPEDLAQSLIQKGCNNQLDMMIQAMASSTPAG
jgi:hypothetical protein